MNNTLELFDFLFLMMVLLALTPLAIHAATDSASASKPSAKPKCIHPKKHSRLTRHYRALLAEFHLRRRMKRTTA